MFVWSLKMSEVDLIVKAVSSIVVDKVLIIFEEGEVSP